ncbi:hypothetical protein NE237_010889 [Protea cynaroides]|uniref:Bifunctional inhibitor/plant lipid transfer protein/seed storage helical domain-containing protein n=1 Tax=Protea cynaroides TaxID=273540 RepID=A0A9Q0L198_9MAGN|nr:hypothetical protein NE237_010889 [Protea cynaroides]
MVISRVVPLASLVMACMVVASPHADAAITCGDDLLPFLSYLRSSGFVPAGCYNSIRSLNTACGCLKSTYSSVSEIKRALASSLPSSCGVRLPYKISPSIDCSKDVTCFSTPSLFLSLSLSSYGRMVR